MKFRTAIPILYSADVVRSLTHYTEVLGFESRWDWGTPPTFGGVCKDAVEIFFCEKGQGSPGTWLSLFVDNVDEYYESIKAKGAKILCPPETMEWNVREMLVEDPDGHRIRFGHGVSLREKSKATLPPTINIIKRTPATKEYQDLLSAVGWSSSADEEMIKMLLSAAIFAVVAEDKESGEAIGCGLVLGDRASFYYIKDIMVHPAWQNKRVGTAMMQELTNWLESNAADNALVGLFTGENLAPFYKKFGFTTAFGMQRRIRRKE